MKAFCRTAQSARHDRQDNKPESAMTNSAAKLPLDAYPATTMQTLRYNDMDPAGHVNNAVYSTLFEAGRVPILYDPAVRCRPPEATFPS
jgi:acyl-ACP thioesterase